MRFTQKEIITNCIPFQKALDLLKINIVITYDPIKDDLMICGGSKILNTKFKYFLGRELLCGFDEQLSIKYRIMRDLQLEELLSVQIDISDDTPLYRELINDNSISIGTFQTNPKFSPLRNY